MEKYDLIFAGRQAIDGDTAQVGPQVAEKLNIPQITYAEELVSLKDNTIQIKRRLENGYEIVEGTLPLLVTVHGTSPDCRPRNAKRYMQFKNATIQSERTKATEEQLKLIEQRPYLNITEWSTQNIKFDPVQLGLGGFANKSLGRCKI